MLNTKFGQSTSSQVFELCKLTHSSASIKYLVIRFFFYPVFRARLGYRKYSAGDKENPYGSYSIDSAGDMEHP